MRVTKDYLDIPSAAYLAGFTSRQFLKIIEEDRIPMRQIGSRLCISSSDLEEWKATRGEARLQAAIQQLDGWIKKSVRHSLMEQAADR